MDVVVLARWERRLRPLLTRLPRSWAVRLASAGRRRFSAALARCHPATQRSVPAGLGVTLWHGLRFRAPLINAAGMFKNGGGHALALAQGAGGYLAGTTTAQPCSGNRVRGIEQPFVPYPRSGAASNGLGLPNDAHATVAQRLSRLPRVAGFPLGASLALDARRAGSFEQRMADLVRGMHAYEAAGVDFLELNESCPNTGDSGVSWEQLDARLRAYQRGFLAQRGRPLPVVVKLSCDTPARGVERLVRALIEYGFDGVNLGNTSVDYACHRRVIDAREHRLYDHFTSTFGGGVSGRPLRDEMLDLVRAAVRARVASGAEAFAVIATGGIETAGDIAAAQAAGASLCQWYTGYFENLGRNGHALYQRIYRALR